MKERKETGESSAGGFSFLSMMGRKYEDEVDEEEVETVIEKNELVEKKKSKPVDKMEHVEKALLKVKVSTKFFVDPLSDEKIKSLAANFRRTQTVEKVIDKWAPHRDAIFKVNVINENLNSFVLLYSYFPGPKDLRYTSSSCKGTIFSLTL